MKKYIVIGNPIEHSLSPLLHNHWFKKYKINANYEKKLISDKNLKNLILELRKEKINGINVTVPFKKDIIPYLDNLSEEAQATESVNTIYYHKNEIIGHNTDIEGFENSVKYAGLDLKEKKIFILGAGGVVSSLIFALNKMHVSKIILSNRTKSKAENLKKLFNNISIIDWGEIVDFDMIINATSIGLKLDEEIDLDFSKMKKNKLYYDVIYNPKQTNFLKNALSLGNKTMNGKMMFVYQALAAFKMWHGTEPKIDNEVIKLLD